MGALPAASAARLARDGGHWRDLTIADAAWRCAEEHGDRTAFSLEAGEVSYGALAAEARRLIGGLAGLGLAPGDRVAFQLPNWIEAVVVDIAAAALGLTVVPIVPIYRDRELGFILADAGVRCVFLTERYRSSEFLGMYRRLRASLPELTALVLVRSEGAELDDRAGEYHFDALLCDPSPVPTPRVNPDAVKAILYTSGTTGSPKAVMHSHNTMTRVIDNMVERLALGPEDRMLMASPVTHITGYANGIVMPFVTPVTTALMERWDAGAAVTFIDRTGASLSVGATPFLKELLDAAEAARARLPSLRYFVCGGASVPPALIRRASEVLSHCRAFRVYGSTETPIITLGWPEPGRAELAAETDGRIYGYEVRVLDDEGHPLPAGEEGEIAARGAGMMLGYKDPEQDAAAYRDGFFLTGDIGIVTPEQAVIITDRKKDIIIRGGENISAREVEEVLLMHEAVLDAAVVAMPHARLGEGVCAFLRVTEGATPPDQRALAAHAEAAGLARQKIPEAVWVIDEFPRTPSGKVRKDRLRAEAVRRLEP